ncbi:hypothetical protein LGM65_32775, partial [Burkholderia anthina]|nr:hypothetical protein [Burkholderia anthina]
MDAIRDTVRAVIEPYEAALRAAMLTNDAEVLDTLLDDVSKNDDLSAHRAKLLRLDALTARSHFRRANAKTPALSGGGSRLREPDDYLLSHGYPHYHRRRVVSR